jgi:hypothetical protein
MLDCKIWGHRNLTVNFLINPASRRTPRLAFCQPLLRVMGPDEFLQQQTLV